MNGLYYTSYIINIEQAGGYASNLDPGLVVDLINSIQLNVPIGEQYFWSNHGKNFEAIRRIERILGESEGDFTARVLDEQLKLTKSEVTTGMFLSTAIHEKNHAIQDKDLPLPLREAQSYWITKALLGDKVVIPIIFNGFINAYQNLYEEFGDDLNRLLWGTLGDEVYSAKLLEKVKQRLTPEIVDDMIPEGFEWTAYSILTPDIMMDKIIHPKRYPDYRNLKRHRIYDYSPTSEIT